jgi:hypothetical protein
MEPGDASSEGLACKHQRTEECGSLSVMRWRRGQAAGKFRWKIPTIIRSSCSSLPDDKQELVAHCFGSFAEEVP